MDLLISTWMKVQNSELPSAILIVKSECVHLQHKLLYKTFSFKLEVCIKLQKPHWRMRACGCWGGSVKERVCGLGLWFGSPDTLGPQEILSKRSWRSVQPPSLLTSCLEAGCWCWHCSPTTEELRSFLPFRLFWLRIKWNSTQRKPQQPSGPPYCRKTSGLNFSTTEEFC